MSWKWAALLPHPPIIVPEVGGGRDEEARATVDGVREVCRRIAELGAPDVVLLLSPHQPYTNDSVALNAAERMRGSFARFGVPGVSFEISNDPAAIRSLAAFFRESSTTPARFIEEERLDEDQGTTVPLYFLRDALGSLPPIVLMCPIGLDRAQALTFGRELAELDDGRSWGLVASADLSHRLKPDGPNGYDENGAIFDDAVVSAMRSNDAAPIMKLTDDQIRRAGECGMRSSLVMLGMLSSPKLQGAPEVLSYEGPFGVGYCTALWTAI